jgi:biotin carboxylase
LSEHSKRVLIFASTTGYQTRAFADAAQGLGCEPVLVTDRCDQLDDPWGDAAIPVKFHRPEESAAHIRLDRPADAVVAVGDRPAFLAALYAERAGLRFHPSGAVAACRSKYAARERFRAAGLPVRPFERYRLDEPLEAVAAQAVYPCVLKPLGLSGSRGVIRADNQREFLAAAARIRNILDDPSIRRHRDEADRYLQVEAFLPGREFALEGILCGGRLTTLALFDKPDPLDGPYFEETIYVTPARCSRPLRSAIEETTARAAAALGLTDGPLHAEMRVNEEHIWMLEVAARPIGGLCAKALRFTRNGLMASLEEMIIRTALGENPDEWRLADAASGVMMIPIPRDGIYCGVRGLDRSRAVAGIGEVIITAKEGQRLRPLPEGATYLGFIFARGSTAGEAENALRQSHAALEFDFQAVLPLFERKQ